MLCNIWVITIIILLISIIGLISFSQNKQNKLDKLDKLEGFEPSLLSNSETIMSNNTKINKLINQLQNLNPSVQLTNYDPTTVYTSLDNNITSNISTINTTLNTLYNTKIANTNTKIDKLEKSVNDLENIVNNMGMNHLTNTKYNTIKSMNNGLELKLLSTPNTVFKDNKTGANIPGYMVMANDGCLSVGATDYDIYKCNDTNPKQIFKMEHILNETAYQNNIDSSLPADNTDKSNINYPFAMIKSINNENCLTNNHGNLTVQPCYSFVAQRWFPL